jgi:hypothetical protein
MYSDVGDNDCFDGQAMQLAINMAKPTLKGWLQATEEDNNPGNFGNSGTGNSWNSDTGNSENSGTGNAYDNAANITDTAGNSVNTATSSPSSSPVSGPIPSSPVTGPTPSSLVNDTIAAPAAGNSLTKSADSADTIYSWLEEVLGYDVLNKTGNYSEIHNTTMARLEHTLGYEAGLLDGYAEAVHAGFDEGYKTAITTRSTSSSDERALTTTVPRAGDGSSPDYMVGYNAGHAIGYDEGYKAGFRHGDIRGRFGDLANYNQGYVGGTQRKLLAEIDADESLPVPQQVLDTPQLRGNHHPQRKTVLTLSLTTCKSLCFGTLDKRQQCAVLGCWTRYPNLTKRRRRRDLQDAGTEEEILHDENWVFQTILPSEGVDGGLDFKNLISDLLTKKCNIADVGFEVWLLCPDRNATAAFFGEANNSTSTTTPP